MEPPAKEAHKSTEAEVPAAFREAAALRAIREAVAGIKFGTVQIVIQDGRVVQIDKTEKIRLT